MNKDNTIFDKETEAVKKAIEALQEMHRAALYDGAKAAQKPIEEELAEKEDEGIELAKLYEEQKPIAEAKVRLLRNASDEAIVRGDPAEAARLSQEAESVLQNLADIKAREQRYYAVSEQLENRLWSSAGGVYGDVYPSLRKSLIEIQKELVSLLDGTVNLLESFQQKHNFHRRVDKDDLTPSEYGLEAPIWRALWGWYSGRK